MAISHFQFFIFLYFFFFETTEQDFKLTFKKCKTGSTLSELKIWHWSEIQHGSQGQLCILLGPDSKYFLINKKMQNVLNCDWELIVQQKICQVSDYGSLWLGFEFLLMFRKFATQAVVKIVKQTAALIFNQIWKPCTSQGKFAAGDTWLLRRTQSCVFHVGHCSWLFKSSSTCLFWQF